MTDHETYEIRARLMAARSVHPGPWHVVGGTLVDGEGRPIDFDATVIREFFRHLMDDMQELTVAARRVSHTRSLTPSSPGLRMPSSAPSEEHVVVHESVRPAAHPAPHKPPRR